MDDGDWGQFGSLEGFLEHDEGVYDAVVAAEAAESHRAWMDSHLLAYAAASVAPVVSQQDLRGLMARAIRPGGRAPRARRTVRGAVAGAAAGDGRERPRGAGEADPVALAADLLPAAGVSR